MKISQTSIPDLMLVETEARIDHRGAFARLYCQDELQSIIGSRKIVQINLSCTHAVGAVRGLHYQQPLYAEMKLVRCLKGKVLDVAVDLRTGSPTFLQWHAEELSSQNRHMLVIPEGCAHGFQVMEPDSELLYLHTEYYTPEAEGGVRYDDPRLAIPWPLPVAEVSVRDQQHPRIPSNYLGLKI